MKIMDKTYIIYRHICNLIIYSFFLLLVISSFLGNCASTSTVYLAAHYGDSKKIAMLAKNGADVNKTEELGWNPILIAAYNGHAEAIKTLLKLGANPEVTIDSYTPLMIAAYNDHPDAIIALLEGGAKPDTMQNGQFSALHMALKKNNLKACKALLSTRVLIDVNRPDVNLNKPIISSIIIGDPELVQLMINKGLDLNTTYAADVSILSYAASLGKNDIIKILLKAGMNVNTNNNLSYVGDDSKRNKITESHTPLMRATLGKHIDTMRLLLASGADINFRSFDGSTALFNAVNQNKDVVKVLIDAGADVNAVNKFGMTPIMKHIQDKEIIFLLKNSGANLNMQEKQGFSALMISAMWGLTDSVKFLIEAGADVNLKNKKGQSAFFFAKDYKHAKIIEILKAAGAK